MDMNEEDIKKQLELQQQALAKIYKSVEQTRKYFLWSMMGTVAMFVLPLIGLLILVPKIISSYSAFGGLL